MADKIDSLSKAIRYGSLFVKPEQATCLSNNVDKGITGCAIGSAFYSISKDIPKTTNTGMAVVELECVFPWLQGLRITNPALYQYAFQGRKYQGWAGLITDLFDNHDWTNDQIADYLQEIGL